MPTQKRPIVTPSALVLITVLLVAGLTMAGAGTTVAADEPSPPPASYYGTVAVDGETPENGTLIVAKIDGETRGEIAVDSSGEYDYGGPDYDDEKLTVNGTESENGTATVEFYVETAEGGLEKAGETVTWESGDHQQVDLTAESTPTSTPTQTQTETSTGGSVGSVSNPPPSTATETPTPADTPVESPTDTQTATGRETPTSTPAPGETPMSTPSSMGTETPADEDGSSFTSEDTPGFGVPVALVALLIASLLAKRRE